MRKIFHQFFSIIFVVGFILVCADFVRACSCSLSLTVGIAFEETQNVAILKIDSLQTKKNPVSGEDVFFLSKMSVQKVYKGSFKVGQEMPFGITGTSCDVSFDKNDIGKEFLMYLDDKYDKSAKQKVWFYNYCSRTGGIEYRKADLKYIENIDKVRGKTRFSGTISQRIESAVEGEDSVSKKLINKSVRIVGNGKDIQVKTDESGVYEIYDLPAGKYQIFVEPIAGYRTIPFGYPIEIKAKQHTEQDITYGIDNLVSGKVYDINGKPLKDVCIHLNPAQGKIAKYTYLGDCTDENGKFKIDEIPIGKYVLVVNEDGEITANEPFETFYYPNSNQKENAQIFTIEAGKHIEELIIKPVPKVETVLLRGKVIFEDGVIPTTARDEYASVKFVPDDTNYDEKNRWGKSYSSSNLINQNGEFNVRVYKGQKGKLFASMHSYVGAYKDCPKLDKLIRAKGESVQDVETNILEIDGEKDLENVILKFPFPSCKKAKID